MTRYLVSAYVRICTKMVIFAALAGEAEIRGVWWMRARHFLSAMGGAEAPDQSTKTFIHLECSIVLVSGNDIANCVARMTLDWAA